MLPLDDPRRNELPTSFELKLVRTILVEQRQEHPLLWRQIPFLRVHSRELTGVGQYVKFELIEEARSFIDASCREGVFTIDKFVQTNTPPAGLGFALDICHGRINLLEILTFGDEGWDGNVGQYQILDI